MRKIFSGNVYIKGDRVQIDLCDNRLFLRPSPVNPAKKYLETNIIYGNSIDFGVSMAEDSMSVRQSVGAKNKVRMTLSLGDRKELDFQFPRMIDNKVRKLRFRLPLTLVNVIYKIDDRPYGKCALIIPFETPPQFFMQTEEVSKTCNPNEKTWIEWYSWYRQTDVVDRATKDRLKIVPVMTHNNGAIIDIGKHHRETLAKWYTDNAQDDGRRIASPLMPRTYEARNTLISVTPSATMG
jgi:RNA-dependent RNA polymerase